MIRLRLFKDVNVLVLFGLQTGNFTGNFVLSVTGITDVYIVRLFNSSACCLFVVNIAVIFIVVYAV